MSNSKTAIIMDNHKVDNYMKGWQTIAQEDTPPTGQMTRSL